MPRPKPAPDYDRANFHLLLNITQQLAYIRVSLARLEKIMPPILDELNTLKETVSENTSVGQSVIALLNTLTAKIDELIAGGGDPTAILAAIAEVNAAVKADTQALADAVVENTPAA